eukprot:6457579-Amphidinium_carterae.1
MHFVSWPCREKSLENGKLRNVLSEYSGANLHGNEHVGVEPDGEQQPQEKPRRGGGGAWRAFVHHRSRKRKLDATTTKSLAEEYHALSPNTRSFYKRLGEDATALHREGQLTFPHYSRAAIRSRGAGGTIGAEHQRHFDEELASRFDLDVSKVGEAVFRGEAVPLTSLPTPRRRDIDFIESMIRSYARQVRVSKRDAEKKSVEDVEGLFGKSEEHAEQILQHRRMLRDLPTCTWRSFPSSLPDMCQALIAEFEPRNLQKFVLEKHDGSWKQTTMLAEAWNRRHFALQQRTWEHHEKRAPPNRRCFHAGVCLCQGPGRKLSSLSQRLADIQKSICKDNKETEKKMTQGFMVVQFQGVPANSKSKCHSTSATSSTTEPPTEESVTMFAHLSLQYLSPWKSTWTQLCLASDADPAPNLHKLHEGTLPKERLRAQVSFSGGRPAVMTQWELLQKMRFDFSWHVFIWLLSNRETPVASVGNHICLCPGPWSVRQLWDGSKMAPPGKQGASGLLDDAPRKRRDKQLRDPPSAVAANKRDQSDELPPESEDEIQVCSEDSEHEGLFDTVIANELEANLAVQPQDKAKSSSSSDSDSSSSSSISSNDGSKTASSKTPANTEPDNSTTQPAAAPAGVPAVAREIALERQAHHDSLLMRSADRVEVFGAIKLNPSQNNAFATCRQHLACVKTKTLRAGARGQGRPLGFLGAWLVHSADCDSKEQHMAFKPCFEERKLARQLLKYEPNAEEFFSQEAIEGEGEEEEPAIVPGR